MAKKATKLQVQTISVLCFVVLTIFQTAYAHKQSVCSTQCQQIGNTSRGRSLRRAYRNCVSACQNLLKGTYVNGQYGNSKTKTKYNFNNNNGQTSSTNTIVNPNINNANTNTNTNINTNTNTNINTNPSNSNNINFTPNPPFIFNPQIVNNGPLLPYRPPVAVTTQSSQKFTSQGYGIYVDGSRPLIDIFGGYTVPAGQATQAPPTRAPQTIAPQTTAAKTNILPSQFGCGYRRNVVSRVIGGVSSESCEFPWMVKIDQPQDTCGGTILDERHILTAAHCVKNAFTQTVFQPFEIKVNYGSNNVDQQKTVSVARIMAHPGYTNLDKNYDVAVLTLSQDIVFGPCVGPICLPPAGLNGENMECITAGWGTVDGTLIDRTPQKLLQKVTLPIISQEQCKSAYPGGYSDLKICAGLLGVGGKDSCLGDSGGPLMCRKPGGPFYEFGIVSYGRKCGEPMSPGVYTNMTHPDILKYIEQALMFY